MTRREYKRLGMHWSIMEAAQRDPDLRADRIGLLELIGRARRVGWLDIAASLWRCYHAIGSKL